MASGSEHTTDRSALASRGRRVDVQVDGDQAVASGAGAEIAWRPRCPATHRAPSPAGHPVVLRVWRAGAFVAARTLNAGVEERDAGIEGDKAGVA